MITNDDLDAVFQALAHATRREMLDLTRDFPGLTVGELAKHFDVSRIAVMNHLAVLEKAGLITSERDGRSRRLYLNAMPIQDIYDRWTNDFSSHWAERVNTIKYVAEAAAKQRGEDNE